MKILSHSEALEPAVRRFNRRMEAAGKGDFSLPESCTSVTDGVAPPVRWEFFIAVDGQSEARGGFTIRRQPFANGGKPFDLSFLKFPVSEGIADRRHAAVGITLLAEVPFRAPSCFALGMGGKEKPLPKILGRLGWRVMEVPFFFKILRPGPVLATLEPFRRTSFRRFAASVANFTGIARAAAFFAHRQIPENRSLTVSVAGEFDVWSDAVWERSKGDYGILAERSSTTLPLIYAPFKGSHEILQIMRNGEILGWTVCLITKMSGDRHFGDLTVATLADGLAPAGEVDDVVMASVRYLEQRRPDLIISNQINRHWAAGLTAAGFRRGPSNFAWAVSPVMSNAFDDDPYLENDSHINRGDGDGPIHL